MHEWWLDLEVSALERARIQCDLDTLVFARGQIEHLEEVMVSLSAEDERVYFCCSCRVLA